MIAKVSPNGDQRADFIFNTQGMVDGLKMAFTLIHNK